MGAWCWPVLGLAGLSGQDAESTDHESWEHKGPGAGNHGLTLDPFPQELRPRWGGRWLREGLGDRGAPGHRGRQAILEGVGAVLEPSATLFISPSLVPSLGRNSGVAE